MKNLINKIKENKNRSLGILLIIVTIIFLVFSIMNLIEERKEDNLKREMIDQQTESILDEENASDVSDIDSEVARDNMSLKIEMIEDMKERIPDWDGFTRSFEDYLIEEGFWGDVTRATSDGVLTEDYNKGSLVLTFTLNDPAQTTITAYFENNKTKVTFNQV